MGILDLNQRVSAAKAETEARGETFYPGASRVHLAAFPPKERWDDWVELDSKAWPERRERRYMLVPTTCFNCESACGLLAYVDKETLQVRKLEGNPEHPGSRGRNCAKGPATLNQITDPDRILHPLKRAGKRGEGKWRRVSWDEALDDIADRVRKAMVEKRHNEIMYHVGRPGEDGFTERVMAAWGVDGHNSHTNICSAGARAGYQLWCGIDRPSPDHANAKVILLISSHLETGHYFNPHAQRILEAKKQGAKLIVLDTRLSNTATHADLWLPTQPGSEAALMLAVANHLIAGDLYNRGFVRRWWNWQEYLEAVHPGLEPTFENFDKMLKAEYEAYTFEFAERETGVDQETIRQVAETVASAGTRLATHNWRSAAAGNEGGWQVARTLFLLNCLTGAVATPGGTHPNAWNKFVARPIHLPRHPEHWNELNWPVEYSLTMYELSFLLPHLVREGRGKLDVYFTRVYNPVWTNPDGFSWIEMLRDEEKVGLHVALTPTWNETAYFADYVLPMGNGAERHDIHSYETHDGQWIGFRQPVLRAARERLGKRITDTREANPGEVWEENELWLDLSWRIDPRRRPRHPAVRRVEGKPRRAPDGRGVLPLVVRELGARPAGKGRCRGPCAARIHAPLRCLRGGREGRPSVRQGGAGRRARGHRGGQAQPGLHPRSPLPLRSTWRPPALRNPTTKAAGRWACEWAAKSYGGSRRRRASSSSIPRPWPPGAGKEVAIPTYMKSHVHPESMEQDQKVLISTFRLPTQIHTRSANAKWLDEISHTNPLWIHPEDAAPLSAATGDLLRVETEIGYFVVKAWVTEGIKPGVVACSHHMGRWKLHGHGQRQLMATVALDRQGAEWSMSRKQGVEPFESSDPDTSRVWWTDAGVHQNMTFPVHPDPVSGMHCWHQAVRVVRAQPGDRYGEISVDTEKSHRVFKAWLEKTRSPMEHSPDGTRRPHWLIRPVKPTREAYRLPTRSRG